MAHRLSQLHVVFLLASFGDRVKGQEDGAYIDQFQSPRLPVNGSVPRYYDFDTLLVKYTSRIGGPSISIALKCVSRSETDAANGVFPDIDTDSLTVVSMDNVPSYAATVPFELPLLPHMQNRGGPSCAFILIGYRGDPMDGNIVSLQSDKFQIAFTRYRGHVIKTYGIEGEVPTYPLATTSTVIPVPTTSPSTTTTKATPSSSNEVSSTTSSSLPTTSSLLVATSSSAEPAFWSTATASLSAPTAESPAPTASTLSTTTSPSASSVDASATNAWPSQLTGTTGEIGTGKGGGLSSAASAGIGAGVTVGTIALLGLAFFLWRRRRQQGKGFVGSSSSKPEADRGENVNVAELHEKHLSELSGGSDYVRSPPQRRGLGVQRAEVGYGQEQPRVEPHDVLEGW